jgi:hypothetical protein
MNFQDLDLKTKCIYVNEMQSRERERERESNELEN